QTINLKEKLSLFSDSWNPRIIAGLNGQLVKLAKLEGEFVWHHHAMEDELFLVISGVLEMHFRDKIEIIRPGECIVVPKGIEHKPVAKEPVEILLFEPESTVNTGNNEGSDLRREKLNWI
ncbi:MAG: cupin domain-containing protein, partial [Saprospiraceae bacterium]|nr:cupin domain-containing protein [Saprospiraceae bacterium]